MINMKTGIATGAAKAMVLQLQLYLYFFSKSQSNKMILIIMYISMEFKIMFVINYSVMQPSCLNQYKSQIHIVH